MISCLGIFHSFIYSSVDGLLDYFHLGANTKKTSIHIQVLVWTYVFFAFGKISKSRMPGSYGGYMLNF